MDTWDQKKLEIEQSFTHFHKHFYRTFQLTVIHYHWLAEMHKASKSHSPKVNGSRLASDWKSYKPIQLGFLTEQQWKGH